MQASASIHGVRRIGSSSSSSSPRRRPRPPPGGGGEDLLDPRHARRRFDRRGGSLSRRRFEGTSTTDTSSVRPRREGRASAMSGDATRDSGARKRTTRVGLVGCGAVAEKWQNSMQRGHCTNGNCANAVANRQAPALLMGQKGLSPSRQGRHPCPDGEGGVAIMGNFCMIAY